MSYISQYAIGTGGTTSTPYLNTRVATGYFYYTNPLSTVVSSNWYSLKTAITASNGLITSPDTTPSAPPTYETAGFRVTSVGVYRLQLALDIARTTDGDRSDTQQYGLGTTFMLNQTDSVRAPGGLLGGDNPTNSYALGTSNPVSSAYGPGIISWVNSTYSNGNSTIGKYMNAFLNYSLSFAFYGRSNGDGYEYPYVCSTTIVFNVTDTTQPIYFQYRNNVGFKLGYTPFTLELLSTQPITFS